MIRNTASLSSSDLCFSLSVRPLVALGLRSYPTLLWLDNPPIDGIPPAGACVPSPDQRTSWERIDSHPHLVSTGPTGVTDRSTQTTGRRQASISDRPVLSPSFLPSDQRSSSSDLTSFATSARLPLRFPVSPSPSRPPSSSHNSGPRSCRTEDSQRWLSPPPQLPRPSSAKGLRSKTPNVGPPPARLPRPQ